MRAFLPRGMPPCSLPKVMYSVNVRLFTNPDPSLISVDLTLFYMHIYILLQPSQKQGKKHPSSPCSTQHRNGRSTQMPYSTQRSSLLINPIDGSMLHQSASHPCQSRCTASAHRQAHSLGSTHRQTSSSGAAHRQTHSPGAAHRQTHSPGSAHRQTSSPGAAHRQTSSPGAAHRQTSSPRAAHRQTSSPGSAQRQNPLLYRPAGRHPLQNFSTTPTVTGLVETNVVDVQNCLHAVI